MSDQTNPAAHWITASTLSQTQKREPNFIGSCQYAPPFPAMPSTMVRLQILLQNRIVDLRSVVSVLRHDPGFVAEIMRLTGSRGQASSHSLNECLLDLGMENLKRALKFIPSWAGSWDEKELQNIRVRLKRSRLTAMAAETISLTLDDIDPEQAYLAGLLHDLPGMVCFNRECPCRLPDSLAGVDPWNLPDYIVEVIRWHSQPGYASPDYFPIVRRIATARAWVDEIQLDNGSLPLGWLQTVSEKPTWHNLPNRASVLRELADGLDHWRFGLAD
jgi:HD-like signal output (HDOD) protein